MPAFARNVLFYPLILGMLLGACSYGSGQLSQITCDDEGAIDGNRICVDGYWVYDDTLDAGRDDVEPPPRDTDPQDADADDTGPDADADAPCIGESDEQFCINHDVECGELTAADECDEQRTVQCDLCDSGDHCLDDIQQCSPCPDQSIDELCQELDEENECGLVPLPELCNGDELMCGDCLPTCEDWSPCIHEQPVDSCSQTLEIERECQERFCDEGMCMEGDVVVETDTCIPPEGVTCEDGVGACEVGICDGDGNCVAQPACAGTDDECGCDECVSCVADDGWYNAGPPDQTCCHEGQICNNCRVQEYRENHRCEDQECTFEVTVTRMVSDNPDECSPCDGELECEPVSGAPCEPANGDQCSTEGLREADCTGQICDDDQNACVFETSPTSGTVSCTYNPSGDSCDLDGCPAETGTCQSDSCESPCPEGECGCTNDSCTDCLDYLDEHEGWEPYGDPYPYCDGSTPCIFQEERREAYGCNDAGTGCEPNGDYVYRQVEVECFDEECFAPPECEIENDEACCKNSTECISP